MAQCVGGAGRSIAEIVKHQKNDWKILREQEEKKNTNLGTLGSAHQQLRELA
jgi:hypothetical protein